MAAKDIVADMPSPAELVKGDAGGGMPPAVDAVPGEAVDPGKVAALQDFEAATTPEAKAAALNDFVYMCVQKLKAEGAI